MALLAETRNVSLEHIEAHLRAGGPLSALSITRRAVRGRGTGDGHYAEATDAALLADIGATNAVSPCWPTISVLALPPTRSPTTPRRSRQRANYLAGHAAESQAADRGDRRRGPGRVNGRVTMTNAAWTVDARTASARASACSRPRHKRLRGPRLGARRLPTATDLVEIGPSRSTTAGTMVVIGSRHRLRPRGLATDARREIVLVTEAGHATLASENRREDAIIPALRDRLQHISVERVLSGPGLVKLYHAIAHIDGVTVPQRSAAESSSTRWPATATNVARPWTRSVRSWAASPATSL